LEHGFSINIEDVLVVGRDAARVGEQLLECDDPQAGVHLFSKLGEDFRHGGGPMKLSLFHHHRCQQGGHRLRVGSYVEPVIDRDRNRYARPAGSRRTGCNYFALFDDRCGDGRKVIL